MTLRTLIENARIDWSKLIVEIYQPASLRHEYQVAPDDYLEYARADVASGGVRGLVNAVSNAKRAIDCQTDTLISSLGLCPNDLSRQLGKANLKTLFSPTLPEQPLSFKLLKYLGIVTPQIVGRTRRLRHNVEHAYRKPTMRSAADAIDVAELYIRALQGMMKDVWGVFAIGSDRRDFPCRSGLHEFTLKQMAHTLILALNTKPSATITMIGLNRDGAASLAEQQIRCVPGDDVFLPLMRLLCSLSRGKTDVIDAIKALCVVSGLEDLARRCRVKEIGLCIGLPQGGKGYD